MEDISSRFPRNTFSATRAVEMPSKREMTLSFFLSLGLMGAGLSTQLKSRVCGVKAGRDLTSCHRANNLSGRVGSRLFVRPKYFVSPKQTEKKGRGGGRKMGID